jgi:hypothetical protein
MNIGILQVFPLPYKRSETRVDGSVRLGPMRLSLIASAALASLALAPATVGVKVLTDCKPSPGGCYWQKVEKSYGSVQYLCRSTNDSAIQKSAKCDGTLAVVNRSEIPKEGLVDPALRCA